MVRTTTRERAHRRRATCHGSVGRRFTWEEACRGVGDSTGGVGVGPQPHSGWVWVVSPLIKARDPERPMAATGEAVRPGDVGALRRFVDVGSAAKQSGRSTTVMF